MAKGDIQPAARKRKPVSGKRIAARIAKFKDTPPVVAGVMPLNPGFFLLERMRAAPAAKLRSKERPKVGEK